MNGNFVVDVMASDASLVMLSTEGDRDAFGQLVVRYQSSICTLAYSSCGNVAQSQDLAQEIFITAWRKLGTLQEPEHFKAWLFAIARNFMHNAFRESVRHPVASVEMLKENIEVAPKALEPDEQTISKEEETLLWQVLSGLPAMYREPMVLYYRQNESMQQVAEVLELSDEAVRQRLSRGRALLTERVSELIQKGLHRSGPTDAFVMSVIGALPIVAAATTAQGAVMGMATTKTAPATGFLGFLKGMGLFLGIISIPVALGAWIGRKLGQDVRGGPEHQMFVARFWRFFGWGLVFLLLLPLLLTWGIGFLQSNGFLPESVRSIVLKVITFWLGLSYPFVVGSIVYWVWKRRKLKGVSQMTKENQPAAVLQEATQSLVMKKVLRRAALFVTVGAAGLLFFCFATSSRDTQHLTSAQMGELIKSSVPQELDASVLVMHYRSLFKEYPETYKTLWLTVTNDGKKSSYAGPVDEALTQLVAEKGIKCPTYIQGRDFEILGTPGRLLLPLAAFVLAVAGISLIPWHAKV